MDLYLTEKDTGARIALALLPDSVKSKSSNDFISYNFVNVGEVKLPSGQRLSQFSWSGVFPGESMRTLPFVKTANWRSPKEMVSIFEDWRKKKTRIVLMLTETPLNCEVYLSSFDYTSQGGSGNISYSVTFIEAKDVVIYTVADANTTQSAQSSNISSGSRPASEKTDTNTNSEQTKTYIVKEGDNLYDIAKAQLSSGERYFEIYELNRETIGNDPSNLRAGMVLLLPY